MELGEELPEELQRGRVGPVQVLDDEVAGDPDRPNYRPATPTRAGVVWEFSRSA